MNWRFCIQKIVSGGQTGADRAAIDIAIERCIPYGGWIPKGRLAEDGPLDRKYQLKECDSADYSVRTEKNILASDGTLIFFHSELSGGSLLTKELAQKYSCPVMEIDLAKESQPFERVRHWISKNKIKILNVAGPRASKCPGIYKGTLDFLGHLFQ